MKWTSKNTAIAARQGWGLFDAEGKNEIQRIDEFEVFPGDYEALLYVAKAALRGSKTSALALRLAQ